MFANEPHCADRLDRVVGTIWLTVLWLASLVLMLVTVAQRPVCAMVRTDGCLTDVETGAMGVTIGTLILSLLITYFPSRRQSFQSIPTV